MKISMYDFLKICDSDECSFYMHNKFPDEEREIILERVPDWKRKELYITKVYSDCGIEGICCDVKFVKDFWKDTNKFYGF